jgi:hypothetical protein
MLALLRPGATRPREKRLRRAENADSHDQSRKRALNNRESFHE